ncbi:hypothetical protein [Phreatobacter oligotrophus]|jgi:hypothetical protein|uniref:hypothetical protein n=1 Tax=Phreatobacter oligotrophus TaxID=1122261 RepID=UPI002355B438|nr:hypothetical protein [Phreatobacter oligotrophus]MBX9991723.1 hypothetical protein [Phreatobacter oligotrophus]
MKTPTLAALVLAATSAAASAMPLVAPAPLERPLVQVQDCGPPIRRIQIDPFTGEQRLVWIRRPCGPGYYGGGGWGGPRVYEERPYYRPAPRYYEPPPVRYYEEEPVYRPRRPPAPGWERDPYTGRDTRILR